MNNYKYKAAGVIFYLEEGSSGLVPELHSNWHIVNLWGRGAEVLVLQTRGEEPTAAGLQELNLSGVMNTGLIPRARDRCLSTLIKRNKWSAKVL